MRNSTKIRKILHQYMDMKKLTLKDRGRFLSYVVIFGNFMAGNFLGGNFLAGFTVDI